MDDARLPAARRRQPAPLPLLRHIIINDSKSSTYKLALLRVLVRIADGARGMVLDRNDEQVTVPFGLVALYWLKAFQPLVGGGVADAPYQQQANAGAGLGFVRDSFRALAAVSPHDLRIGGRFTGVDAGNLTRALRDICTNIRKMPATFTTLPGSDAPVFRAGQRTVRGGRPSTVTLDREFLTAFGAFEIPIHVWDAMSRYACWIEPAIVNEWSELMRGYEERRDVRRTMDDYRKALVWLEPERDTARGAAASR